MEGVEADQWKTTEDWLREEIRASRTLMVNLMQWGSTVLAAAELNLYYIRRDVTKHLVDLGRLGRGELIPFLRWCMGTLLLALLAYVFSAICNRTVKHHHEYRRQLLALKPPYSHINEGMPIDPRSPQFHRWLFWGLSRLI